MDISECFRRLFKDERGKSIHTLGFDHVKKLSKESCQKIAKTLETQYRLQYLYIEGVNSVLFDQIISRNFRLLAIAEVQQCVEDNVMGSIKRGKITFLGNGGAGKTTTRKHLFNEKYDISAYHSTEVAEANKTGIVSQLEGEGWNAQVKTNEWVQKDFNRINFPKVEVSDAVIEAVGRNYVEKMHVVDKEANHQERRGRNAFDMVKNHRYKSNHEPHFSLWDFGGQEVFYALHHIFLTDNALYLLVVNLRRFETDTAEEKENFIFWMDSLRLHAPYSPIMIIGTFTDRVQEEHTLNSFDEFIKLYQSESTLEVHFNNDISFYPLTNKPQRTKVGKFLTLVGAGKLVSKRERSEMVQIRMKIEGLSERGQNNTFSRFIHREFPSSWLYFMCFIDESYGNYVSIKKLKEEAEEFNLENSLFKMFKFFTDSGTILFFEYLDLRENLVILNPQWLMGAFSGLIFDHNLHMNRKMNMLNDHDDKKKLIVFGKSGIISRTLLPKLFPEFEKEAIDFIVSLGMRLMLIADYFYPSYEEQNILIACMLPKIKRPAFDEAVFHIWIEFVTTLPMGYFSRFVCYFVQKVHEYGSVVKPVIYHNYALFKIQDCWAFKCFQTENGTSFKLLLEPDSVSFAHQVYQLAEEAIQSTLNSTWTVIEYDAWGKRNDTVVLLKDVFKAKERNQTTILSKENELVSVKEFLVFYTPPPDPDKEFDCFLSHCWGYEAVTHHIVERIYEMLQPDVKCWFDAVCLNGHIYQSMCNGIKQSKNYVIFLSQALMDSVEHNSGNVVREFYFLTSHGKRKPIVLVVLESHLLDPINWSEQFQFMVTRTTSFIDMSSDEMIKQNCSELRDAVLKQA